MTVCDGKFAALHVVSLFTATSSQSTSKGSGGREGTCCPAREQGAKCIHPPCLRSPAPAPPQITLLAPKIGRRLGCLASTSHVHARDQGSRHDLYGPLSKQITRNILTVGLYGNLQHEPPRCVLLALSRSPCSLPHHQLARPNNGELEAASPLHFLFHVAAACNRVFHLTVLTRIRYRTGRPNTAESSFQHVPIATKPSSWCPARHE